MNQFARTELLIGPEGVERLHNARVAVFGVGGVGGFAAEALVRAGVGAVDLIDNDTVSLTNLNRQIIALHSTIGRDKVDVMAERLMDINPDVKIVRHKLFYLPETADAMDLSCYDYIVDAVDTVAAKLELIVRADRLGVPLICAMGAGNKLDPEKIVLTDIYKTDTCPLARVIRTQCKKRGIRHLRVAYSTEPALKPLLNAADTDAPGRRAVPGSMSFVPSVMGLMIAGDVVRSIIGMKA